MLVGSLNCSAQNNTQPTAGATYLTSSNLLQSSQGSWSNTVPGSTGGTSGGPTPAFNASTNTIIFSYSQKTVAQTYAFNQALQSAGLSIGGYDYSWKINNADMNTGTLSGKFTLTAVNGTSLQTYNYTYNGTTTGDSENFQTYSGTQWFPQNHSSSNISGFTMEWTGKDSRFWAGYYGPRVREPSIALRYLVDLCASNPLSSPDCPGYAEAYKTQQCTANPLYDPTCPGYTVAFKTQQCSIDATYDPTCPGYTEAYKTKQCTLNPLYATDCPGYAEAYFNDQCKKDSLYDKKCEGYATAYAIKYLVNLDPVVTTAVNQQLTTNVEIAKADPAKVTVVNSTVDSILATPSTTSTTSPTSLTSTNSVIAPPPPAAVSSAATSVAAPPPPLPPAKQEEKVQDQKKTDNEVANVEKKSGGNPENAKKGATAKATEIAKSAGKAATLEAQVASQGLLVGLMGYVPGFNSYQTAIIQDTNALEMAKKYSKPVVDNVRAQRRLSGANEERWKEMVDSQYKTEQ